MTCITTSGSKSRGQRKSAEGIRSRVPPPTSIALPFSWYESNSLEQTKYTLAIIIGKQEQKHVYLPTVYSSLSSFAR